MKSIFGPCVVTHGGTDMGKTSTGGSLKIVITEKVIDTLDGPIYDPAARYGLGKLNMFVPIAGTISTDIVLADFAGLVLTGDDFALTMPAAKL